jgi:hypothetical protein
MSPTRIFLVALVGTFVLTRASLSMRPNADVFIGGYNIHHLYTGALIATACGIPLVVGSFGPRLRMMLIVGFGIGTSLVLDEIVYLIATDGSNAAYLTRVSWIGGAALICAAVVLALLTGSRRESSGPGPRAPE